MIFKQIWPRNTCTYFSNICRFLFFPITRGWVWQGFLRKNSKICFRKLFSNFSILESFIPVRQIFYFWRISVLFILTGWLVVSRESSWRISSFCKFWRSWGRLRGRFKGIKSWGMWFSRLSMYKGRCRCWRFSK